MSQSIKTDSPALLDAGIKRASFDELRLITVLPFSIESTRHVLYDNLCFWRKKVTELGLKADVWIDGSFVTSKENPADIDLVVIPLIDECTINNQDSVDALKNYWLNRDYLNSTLNLDLYIIQSWNPNFEERKSYWRGWLGFCRDEVTAKGFFEVSI